MDWKFVIFLLFVIMGDIEAEPRSRPEARIDEENAQFLCDLFACGRETDDDDDSNTSSYEVYLINFSMLFVGFCGGFLVSRRMSSRRNENGNSNRRVAANDHIEQTIADQFIRLGCQIELNQQVLDIFQSGFAQLHIKINELQQGKDNFENQLGEVTRERDNERDRNERITGIVENSFNKVGTLEKMFEGHVTAKGLRRVFLRSQCRNGIRRIRDLLQSTTENIHRTDQYEATSNTMMILSLVSIFFATLSVAFRQFNKEPPHLSWRDVALVPIMSIGFAGSSGAISDFLALIYRISRTIRPFVLIFLFGSLFHNFQSTGSGSDDELFSSENRSFLELIGSALEHEQGVPDDERKAIETIRTFLFGTIYSDMIAVHLQAVEETKYIVHLFLFISIAFVVGIRAHWGSYQIDDFQMNVPIVVLSIVALIIM
uniref:t-SNARE coiled-coil homology domain-containing protein n=1 Tax=Caenorhabditis tropicalis TaxID=1561998 RepID=A0A1I7UBQ8_9PELO